MVIANYSPQHGQTGATSNMLAIILVLILKFNLNILAMQSHFKMNNLEASLWREPKQIKITDPFDDYGMDSLIRNRKMAQMDKKMLEYSCHTLMDGKLHLLPGTRKVSEEVYERESGILLDIMEMARKQYDHVFIDVNSGDKEITNRILEEADLVLVNLCQNPQVLDNYFSNPKEIDSKKLFLIGNYDSRCRCNLQNMRYNYPELEKKITLPIEYCVGYKDAIFDSETIRFFKRNLDANQKSKNYRFMKNVTDAAERIVGWKG